MTTDRSNDDGDAPVRARAGAAAGSWEDRRTRLALRSLVDDMITQIRAISTNTAWSDDERARAESDLERIMASVRRETLRDEVRET